MIPLIILANVDSSSSLFWFYGLVPVFVVTNFGRVIKLTQDR